MSLKIVKLKYYAEFRKVIRKSYFLLFIFLCQVFSISHRVMNSNSRVKHYRTWEDEKVFLKNSKKVSVRTMVIGISKH